jgi:murein DD-endopeptidase MepM/ murein hydrolase activator NlpD
VSLIHPYTGTHSITQPFGITSRTDEPRGWLQYTDGAPLRFRTTAFSSGSLHGHVHPAIDVAMPVGTILRAVQSGVVVARGFYTHDTAGNPIPDPERWLMLQIRPGTVVFYTHLSSWLANSGAHVRGGDPVAASGNSGITTGPHLHWELRIGPTTGDYHLSSGWYRWSPSRFLFGGDHADSPLIVPD